jgi:hypothetical protein
VTALALWIKRNRPHGAVSEKRGNLRPVKEPSRGACALQARSRRLCRRQLSRETDMKKRKYDDTTLILAGGIAAALIGAGAASGWVWLRQQSGETARAHRKRATGVTAVAFGAAGALGAALAAALLGPRAAKPSMRALEHMADHVDHDWAKMLSRVNDMAHAASDAAKKYGSRLH